MSVRKLKEQVDGHESVLRQLVNELQNTKELCIGTLEVVKLLPDYEKALKKLTDNYEKETTTKLDLGDVKDNSNST